MSILLRLSADTIKMKKKKIIDVAGEILFHYINLGEIVILYDTDNLEMIQICFNFFHSPIRPVHDGTQ